ncbi:MAG TPA: SurA N-terminal domain-containing protein [Devosiaceae bacterium]|nr:SurA N-terminal domain-containing protein [Devosiaceae bacterium]
MLHALRAFAQTWIAKVLLAILVVSFGAFGINNVVTNLGGNTVARVGDVDITTQDFGRAYQTQLNQVAQQIGKVPSPQDAMAMGIPSQVIMTLAGDAAVDKFAQSMGVGTSDAHLSKMLGQDPSFQNTVGRFDPTIFSQVLQQNGYTQQQYLDQQAKASRSQQVGVGIFGDAVVPQAALELANRYSADTRTLNYFVLNSTNIPAIPDPTDTDLTAYLKAHQADYRTKETRSVDVMTISPAILAATIAVPDAQIVAEYDRTKASLIKPERRDIKQAVLTDAQAKAFTDGKAAGKSFDDLVKQTGVSVSDLGSMTRDGLSDSALATAAFGLKQGDFALIPGIQGQRAVTVSSIEPGGQISMADAKADIAKNLATQQATNAIGDDIDDIETLRAGKQPLTAIAPRYKLAISSVALTADGAELSAVPGIAEADRAKVAQAIFAAKEGAITPSIQLSSNQNVWFDLKKIDPARDQTLAEVRDALARAWTLEKTDAAMKAEAEKLVANLKAGQTFDDIASGINQFPILSQPITRQGDQSTGGATNVLDSTVAQAAFNGGEGHFGYAVNGSGDYVVFQVQAVNPASGVLSAQTTAAVQDSLRNSLYGDFVTGLRDQYGLRINQQALNQAMALDQNGQ